MNTRTIDNAKSQLKEFGKIRLSVYQNRNYENGGDEITLNSMDELMDFFNFGLGQEDDFSLHHANYFN